MSAWIAPLGFAVLIWWFSTGAILWLDGFSKKYFRTIFLASSVLLFFAFWGISISSTQDTVLGAYCAFTCAILIWGWQELAFLLGYIRAHAAYCVQAMPRVGNALGMRSNH